VRRILVLVAGLLVLAVALGSGVYFYYDAKLTRVAIPGLGHVFGSTASAATSVGENFLLVGSDTRGFAGGQAFQAAPGTPDFVAGARSDTVILLHLPRGGGKPTLVSFPRDTYVQVPSFTDRRGQVSPAHTRPSSTRRTPSAARRCSPSSSNSSPACAWTTTSRSTSGASARSWTRSAV